MGCLYNGFVFVLAVNFNHWCLSCCWCLSFQRFVFLCEIVIPVDKENPYAFVDESTDFVLTDNSGYIIALVDKTVHLKQLFKGQSKVQ